ncbi:MAG: hypothetical protein Q9185_001501 [Variospora sp. 1 TL-2023]
MSAVEETPDGPVEVIQVLFALHPGFGAQELCGPLEILSKAHHKINDPKTKAFECTFAAPSQGVTSSSGLTIKADIDLSTAHEDLGEYDVLIIPGGDGVDAVLKNESEPLGLIKAFAKLQISDPSKERTLMSIGTGSLLLAQTGILQGLSATTHPDYYTKMEIICKDAARRGELEQTDVMEENYVVNNARFELGEKLEENPFVLSKRPDGRRKSIARKGSNAWKESVKRRESNARRASLRLGGLRLITSGGITSGLDASLYLVAAMVSHESAQEVARVMQYTWNKGVTVEGIDVRTDGNGEMILSSIKSAMECLKVHLISPAYNPSTDQIFPQSVDRTDAPEPKKIKFASLGLVVLDEIHFPAKATQRDVLGGSGSYDKRFHYVTPVLGVKPEHFRGTPLLDSLAFHLLAEPEEAMDTIRDLLQLRTRSGIHHRPLIIWEPRPSSCIPSNLTSFYRAMAMVDVFSPNHIELGACFGYSFVQGVDLKLVESLATEILESGFPNGREGSVVIRAAEHGSLPHPKVVDPTGAGNAFLGGYAIALQETPDFVKAARYGTVAASFALEQIGLPVLSIDPCSGEEVWNGCDAFRRLKDYESRL